MKNYSECLNETYNLFKTQGVNILGKGIEEVMSSPTLFEGYVTSLVEGASADSRAQIAQLLANANTHLLTEGSVAGIAPVSSLTGPVIRKLWPSFAMKNAVDTAVAETPAFMINYTKPYFVTTGPNGEEVKHYVPRPALMAGAVGSTTINDFNQYDKSYKTVDVTITNGIGTVDFNGDDKWLEAKTSSRITRQPIDADFRFESYKLASYQLTKDEKVVAGKTYYSDTNGTKVVSPNDSNITTYYELKEGDSTIDGVVGVNKTLGIENAIYEDLADGTTIIVRVDQNAGKAKVAVIGNTTVISVKLTAHRSPEYNEITTSWSFDIEREDIRIGAGEHMNSPLAIEALTDMKALYQIDGTKMAVEIMTNAMALDVDGRILNFLKTNFKYQPGHKEFRDYPGASQYMGVFDVKPMVGYAGGPKGWREELKPVIDHVAARIKNQTFLGKGHFNLVGNPLDIMLITNVDWSFRAGQNAVDGVDVNYSVGTYYGASNTYKIVSSEIVPQGIMYLVFIPSGNDQLTYKYWAYTFSTELGYRDPNRSMVPSVMLCKRDVMKAFMPAIGAIKIIGNDAGAAYDPFRDVIPTVANGAEKDSGELFNPSHLN